VSCGASAIRLRGEFGKLAAGGLIVAASQLGLAIGLIVVNVCIIDFFSPAPLAA